MRRIVSLMMAMIMFCISVQLSVAEEANTKYKGSWFEAKLPDGKWYESFYDSNTIYYYESPKMDFSEDSIAFVENSYNFFAEDLSDENLDNAFNTLIGGFREGAIVEDAVIENYTIAKRKAKYFTFKKDMRGTVYSFAGSCVFAENNLLVILYITKDTDMEQSRRIVYNISDSVRYYNDKDAYSENKDDPPSRLDDEEKVIKISKLFSVSDLRQLTDAELFDFQRIIGDEIIERKISEKTLYKGEYIVGSDLPPGVYVVSSSALAYSQFWGEYMATLVTYDYNALNNKWIKNQSLDFSNEGEKARVVLADGQKINIGLGEFQIVEYTYRESSGEQQEEVEEKQKLIQWLENGVGSKLPKPFGASGTALELGLGGLKNSDVSFEARLIGSKNDFDSYVRMLKEWGFEYVLEENDVFSVSTFKARNHEEYEVKVEYVSFVGIQVEAYAPGEAPSYW